MTQRRCSAANVWWRCAMSPAMVVNAPERPTSPAVEEGTAAHELAELVLTGQIGHADDMVGRISKNGVEFDQEMSNFVMGYVEFIHDLFGDALHVEQRVEYPTPGTTDGAGVTWDGHTLRVADLKYGRSIVEAFENYQILNYAFGFMHLRDVMPSRVEMWIYQPRAPHQQGPVRSWTLEGPEEIKRLYNENAARAQACDVEDPKGHAGAHCRYCDAVGACSLAADWLRVGGEKTLAAAYQPLEGYDLAQDLDLYEGLAKVLDARLKAHQEQAEHLINSGTVVPGWTVSDKFGNRKIKDGVDLSMLEGVYGVPMFEQKPKTPAAIERELKAAGLSHKVVADLFEKPKTGFKLSRLPNPQEIFK